MIYCGSYITFLTLSVFIWWLITINVLMIPEEDYDLPGNFEYINQVV